MTTWIKKTMAKGQHEVNIVLTLDGKQFTGNIKTAGDAAKLFNKVVGKSSKDATGSVNDLNTRLKSARTTFEALPPSSAKYGRALKRVQILQNHLSKSTATATMNMSKFGGASGKTGFAILNMNRVISDAPFGMIAISNNIEPLVNSMMSLSTTSGGVKGAFKALAGSMMGPLGIMTAVSLVTAGITAYTLRSQKAKTATKNQKDETDALIKKLREYQGTLRDLEKLELEKKEKELKAANVKLKALKRDFTILTNTTSSGIGGGSAIAFAGEQVAKQQEKVKLLEAEIKPIREVDKATRDLISSMEKQATAMSGKEFAAYLNTLKLTENQMRVVANSFRESKRDIDTSTQAYKNNITAIKHFDTALSLIEGKQSKSSSKKGNSIEVNLKAEPNTLTKAQQKIFNQIKENFRTNGIMWNASTQAFALNMALQLKEVGGDSDTASKILDETEKIKAHFEAKGYKWNPFQEAFVFKMIAELADNDFKLKPVKATAKKPEVKLTQKELQGLRFEANLASIAINQTADALVNGFMEGNIQIGEMISNIGALIAKMLIVQAIKIGLNAAFPGLGLIGGFSSGGISTKPQHMQFVNPKVFAKAPHYNNGGIAGVGTGIPAILHKKEMILTEQDQTNLLGLIRGARGGGYGGIQKVDVNISGSIRAKKDSFVADFNKASADRELRKGGYSVANY